MDRALLLDRNYLAISILPLKRAIGLIVKGKAEPVGEKGIKIKTGSGYFTMPTIVRLLTNIPYRAYINKTKFSRKNVIIRDNFECQYCGKKFSFNSGTIDHIVPRSRGGVSDYSNCVACCKTCNSVKANKSPEEVGLTLRRSPRRPTVINLYQHYLKDSPEEWDEYLIGIK